MEALAVVWAVKHLRSYVYGHRCDVCFRKLMLESLGHIYRIEESPQPAESPLLVEWDADGYLQLVQSLPARCPSRPIRVPLTPIPVAGPFDRVGVDIIQFSQSHDGNKYAVVFN